MLKATSQTVGKLCVVNEGLVGKVFGRYIFSDFKLLSLDRERKKGGLCAQASDS